MIFTLPDIRLRLNVGNRICINPILDFGQNPLERLVFFIEDYYRNFQISPCGIVDNLLDCTLEHSLAMPYFAFTDESRFVFKLNMNIGLSDFAGSQLFNVARFEGLGDYLQQGKQIVPLDSI